ARARAETMTKVLVPGAAAGTSKLACPRATAIGTGVPSLQPGQAGARPAAGSLEPARAAVRSTAAAIPARSRLGRRRAGGPGIPRPLGGTADPPAPASGPRRDRRQPFDRPKGLSGLNRLQRSSRRLGLERNDQSPPDAIAATEPGSDRPRPLSGSLA